MRPKHHFDFYNFSIINENINKTHFRIRYYEQSKEISNTEAKKCGIATAALPPRDDNRLYLLKSVDFLNLSFVSTNTISYPIPKLTILGCPHGNQKHSYSR